MSFVKMNIFARRIWGFDRDDPEMPMALAAAWSRADLVWERLTAALSTGDLSRTGRLFLGADLVARPFFDTHDLRRANTFENRSFLARRKGRMARAEVFQKRALTLWPGASGSI